MTPCPAITPRDCRATLSPVKPLRFAPTPVGAGGLDRASGPPRLGNYVMAGDAYRDISSSIRQEGGLQ
jgi:hypothetical protein